MDSVRTLIVGAGVTGLATAAALSDAGDDGLPRARGRPRRSAAGARRSRRTASSGTTRGTSSTSSTRTIEQWLRDRMPGQRIRVVEKKSLHRLRGPARRLPLPEEHPPAPAGRLHRVPLRPLLRALERREARRRRRPRTNFLEMLHARFGKGICDRFLVPYNEKLYACDLATLDKDAMGRFFPHADLTDIVRNMKHADNASYNATFTYPEGGAIEYVKALASAVRAGRHRARRGARLGRPRAQGRDARRAARSASSASCRAPRSTASPPMCGARRTTASAWAYNKVLVFNLGFDAQGPAGRALGATTRRARPSSTASAGTTTSSTPTG